MTAERRRPRNMPDDIGISSQFLGNRTHGTLQHFFSELVLHRYAANLACDLSGRRMQCVDAAAVLKLTRRREPPTYIFKLTRRI